MISLFRNHRLANFSLPNQSSFRLSRFSHLTPDRLDVLEVLLALRRVARRVVLEHLVRKAVVLLQRSFRNDRRASAEAGRIRADRLQRLQLQLLLVLGQGGRQGDGPLGGGGHVASGAADFAVGVVAAVSGIDRNSEMKAKYGKCVFRELRCYVDPNLKQCWLL